MSLAKDWAEMEIKLFQRPNLSRDAIEVARMMFYYGAGVVMQRDIENPMALPAIAGELRDSDLAQASRNAPAAPAPKWRMQ